jgi:hypothetical protein
LTIGHFSTTGFSKVLSTSRRRRKAWDSFMAVSREGTSEGLKFGRSAKRLFCLALESHSNRMLRSEFCTLISLLASTVPSRTQSSKLRAKLASLETTPRAGHLKARPCLRVSATLRC